MGLSLVGRRDLTVERPSFSPPTVEEALQEASWRLSAAGIALARLDAEVLLGSLLGRGRAELYRDPQRALDEAEVARWEALLVRRLAREPVVYITGRREFFGLSFQVDRRVLIPRPETEHLVEEALRMARRRPARTIADIGTGCGAIGIALAKNLPQARLYLVDVSPATLELAHANAQEHGVESRVVLLEGDLLEPLPEKVDMAVANLPYIPSGQWESLAPEIRLWEPRLALDGGGDGLSLIRRFLAQVGDYTEAGSAILAEIGAGQGERASALAAEYLPGARVRVLPDYAGHDRVLVVER